MPIVSFTPKISMAKPVIRQSEANLCKENLNRVEKAVRKFQISDIGAMTEKIQLNSKLNETKVSPIKYVEEIKPQNISSRSNENLSVGSVQPGIENVIKKFHKQNAPSNHEKAQVLTEQMNMLATSNMILHGLR